MPLTRRRLMQAVSASGLAAFAPSRLIAAEAAARLTLSAPLTHSDWMLKPGMAPGLVGVKHMLDACKACGWSHVYWRAFDAGQSTYHSKLLEEASRPTEDNYFNPQNQADLVVRNKFSPLAPERAAEIIEQLAANDYAKFDSLATAIDYGHKIGLKIHAWATINEDDHGWGWQSEFSKAHPECRWVRCDGRPYRSQLSFAFPEVRHYKLALIEELLRYDIDGLFIDWIRTGDVRDNPQTDATGVADSGYEAPNVEAFKSTYGVDPHEVPNDDERWLRVRATPQTVFMRGLRKLVNDPPPLKGGARGGIDRRDKVTSVHAAQSTSNPSPNASPQGRGNIPIAVMVGHPWHYRGMQDPIDGNLRGLLLDVATWAREGLIDAAVPAGYYRAGGSAEAAYRALAEETGGACDLWYYGWVPQTPQEFAAQFDSACALGVKRMLFWEADYIDDRPNAAALKSAMSARALPD